MENPAGLPLCDGASASLRRPTRVHASKFTHCCRSASATRHQAGGTHQRHLEQGGPAAAQRAQQCCTQAVLNLQPLHRGRKQSQQNRVDGTSCRPCVNAAVV